MPLVLNVSSVTSVLDLVVVASFHTLTVLPPRIMESAGAQAAVGIIALIVIVLGEFSLLSPPLRSRIDLLYHSIQRSALRPPIDHQCMSVGMSIEAL